MLQKICFLSLTYTVYMQFIQAHVQLCATLWKLLPTWGVPASQAVMVSLTQYCLAGSMGHCQAWAPHRGSGCVRACMMRAAGTRYFSQPIIILWHCATPCICVWVGVSDWVSGWMSERPFNVYHCVEMLPSQPWTMFSEAAYPDNNPKCHGTSWKCEIAARQTGLSWAI